ncbi:MAG: hypothetical protein LDLANPLL_02824 [Turneriella sp.]|nr:hypothetical protein [Turneriella sp.]
MLSVTTTIGVGGAFTAFYTALALLLGRQRSALRITGAGLFLLFAAAIFMLAAYLGGFLATWPHLFLSHLPAALLLGPFTYLFIRCAGDASFALTRKSLLHALPAILCVLWLRDFYILPAATKATLFGEPSLLFQLYPPLQLRIIFVLSYALPLVYTTFAVWFARRFFTAPTVLYFFRALAVFLSLICLGAICMICAVLTSQRFFFKEIAIVLFSLSCAIAFVALMRTPQFPELLGRDARRYQRLTTKASWVWPQIRGRIIEEKLYLNDSARLVDIASHFSLRPDQLSQLVNDNEKINFNRFINRLRIQEVCRRLEKDKEVNILGTAFACGFNSKSAFNTAFRLETGVNPSEYLKTAMKI